MLAFLLAPPRALAGGLLLLSSSFLLAQTPASQPSQKGGKEVLKEVDGRLYRASEHGLKSFSFCFRPTVNIEDTKSFRVRYTSLGKGNERVEYLDDEGKSSATPPVPFEKEAAFFSGTARSFARLFRGQRLVDRFRHCGVRVITREVNLRKEIQLVLEPHRPKNLRRLTLSLTREGLPWKWERRLLNGHTRLEEHNYEKREKGRILTSMKVMMSATRAGQKGVSYSEELSWQKVNGILVPASITKHLPSPKGPVVTKVVFTDVKVNDGLER